MAIDIGEELLKRVTEAFNLAYNEDVTIKVLEARLNSNKATLIDAQRYAERVGEILARVYGSEVSEAGLPDGRMYWNIAQNVIYKPMVNNYELSVAATAKAIAAQNKRAGLGIKAVVPKVTDAVRDRIEGLMNKVSEAEHYDDVAFALDRPVVNFTMKGHDDTVQENADFQSKAGLGVKVVRSIRGRDTCDWCKAVAGTYDYDKVKNGHDVWRRHLDCDCLIEFVSEKGREVVQNYKRSNREQIEARKQLEAPNDRTQEKIEARKRVVGVDAKPLEGKKEKKLSELGKFSEKYRNEGRMGEEYYKTVRKKFSNGSESAKKAFNKFVPKNSVAAYKTLNGAYYENGKVHLNVDADIGNARGEGASWFHEHGHLIDEKAGYISKDKVFYRLLEEDYNRVIENGKRYGASDDFVFDALGREMSSMRKHSAVSDLYNALSDGKIEGAGCHDLDYWGSWEMYTSEAFAHMYEAQFDKVRYKEMKKYFPEALKYFEKRLEVISRDS